MVGDVGFDPLGFTEIFDLDVRSPQLPLFSFSCICDSRPTILLQWR
jgi:hypothetical protein